MKTSILPKINHNDDFLFGIKWEYEGKSKTNENGNWEVTLNWTALQCREETRIRRGFSFNRGFWVGLGAFILYYYNY